MSYVKTAKSSQFSSILRLTYGISEEYGETSAFTCTPVDTNTSLVLDAKISAIQNDPYSYNNKSGLNLLLVGNEFMSYSSIDKFLNGDYSFHNVIRGIYDTLPVVHTAGELVILLDYGLDVDSNTLVAPAGKIVNEQLEVTVDTNTDSEPFDVSKVTHLTTTRRSEQPSIMANLRFGADRGELIDYKYNYPATTQFAYNILFSFICRNKFNNYGIISQIDKDVIITMDSNVNNVLMLNSNKIDTTIFFDSIDKDTLKNIDTITLNWAEFCHRMGRRLMEVNDVSLTVCTYDNTKELYSHDSYLKRFYYVAPRLGGIVLSENKIKPYADSIVESTIIHLPETDVSPETTFTYEDCVLIFVGEKVNFDATDASQIMGQDGLYYHLTDIAYRIDGYNSDSEDAVIHKVIIDAEFVLRSNFTSLHDNYTLGYQFHNKAWMPFTFYVD